MVWKCNNLYVHCSIHIHNKTFIMGRDYRHKTKKADRFEDGYEFFKERKLDSYDRNKGRKQNKINLNHFQIDEDEEVVEIEFQEGEE